MANTPLLIPTLAILAVAAIEWRATRWVAIAAVAADVVLMAVVLRWPGLSLGAVVDVLPTGAAAALLVARVIGAGCFLWCVARLVRTSGIPW